MSRHRAPEPVMPDLETDPLAWAAWASTVVLEDLDRWQARQKLDAETLAISAVQA